MAGTAGRGRRRSASPAVLTLPAVLALLAGCATTVARQPVGGPGVSAVAGAAPETTRRASSRPLFDRATRAALVSVLENAPALGLAADTYLTPALRRGLARRDLAGADRLLADAAARLVEDAATPRGMAAMLVADPLAEVRPPARAAVAATLATAADPTAALTALTRRHPLFDRLNAARAIAAPPDAARLRAATEAARALPGNLPPRHIVVDLASQRLWMYEDARAVGSMRVVVGKPDQPTPLLASAVHEIILAPYWNVPVDLVPARIARPVLKKGIAALAAERFEVLSGWDEDARPVDPRKVRWARVASGAEEVRVRQRPHPGNMMGKMKFPMPNDLGIYLHDTPLRADFARPVRAASAGCVRLEDARRLAEWLLAGKPLPRRPRPEQAVPLARPVPVWFTYLAVDPETLKPSADPYGWTRTGGPAAPLPALVAAP